MKPISFSMTTKAFLEGRKTVTRRLGWKGLRPGEQLVAVKKAMGLKKGEKIEKLGLIEVLDVRRERVEEITAEDVAREGLDEALTPEGFIERFCAAMKCRPDDLVTRIEFRVVSIEPGLEASSAKQGSLFA